MRKLPVLVEPFAGETVSSVYRRLADRNAVPTGNYGRRSVTLTRGFRCARHLSSCRGWSKNSPTSRPGSSTAAALTDCSSVASTPTGDTATARPARLCRPRSRNADAAPAANPSKCTRTGAVCVRHRRWHYAGADRDLTRSADFIRAERCLTGTLWERGIGPETGELELATALLRGTDLGQEDESHQTALERHYPEAVRLVALTTEPWAERFLANTNVGPIQVAALVEAAVNAVTTGTSHDVDAVRASFRAEGRETVIGLDRPMRFRCGRSSGLDELGRRILTLAPRVRATLLRHADARRRSARRPRGSSRHARV